ncbi:hypothetical protein MASR2M8_10820 [Opitutaceae bacterium]
MITSRRDYLLRLIEEVSRALARITTLRSSHRELDALQSVVAACERLFGLEADKLFQLSPSHHFAMLTENELSESARERLLLYAALNQEAGLAYAALNNPTMARASFTNALRFTLLARIAYGEEDAPDFAPTVPALLEQLKDEPLDADIEELLRTPV